MTWIDKNTAILKDKSIIIFHEDGKVDCFYTEKWRRFEINRKQNKPEGQHFKSKKQAIAIYNLIETMI
jgi:hypothetical protein